MRSRLMYRLAFAAVIVFTSLAVSAAHAAVVQNRIAGAVNGNSRVPLQGTISKARMQRTADLGAAAADRKLQSISLHFSLTAAQQADLTQLLENQQTPGSASYHQWLTPEQYGARFGLSSSDMAKVSSWLISQGFAVTGVARSANSISFSGTVAQVQQAFGTSIHNLSYQGEQHISNTTDPVLPSGIAAVVSGITGLNDFRLKPRSRVRSVSIDPSKPLYTQTINGTTSHYISPADFYTIYDLGSLNSANINGTGVTIAIMGQTDIVPADITAFRTAAGLPAINLTQKLVTPNDDPGVSTNDVDEAHIDVEWSSAAAPGATILYVYSGVNSGDGGVFESLSYAIQNKVAPIVSISYGLCEPSWGTSTLATYNSLLAQANAEGITVVGPSGDSGATDCDVANLSTEGLTVDFPSSSPYVVSAGGTMFSGDVNTPSTYWSSSNGSTGGSALSYIPEQPWNETNATGGLDVGGAAGGGASAFFAKPAWQVAMNVPSDSSRDVPDISLNAASDHDGYLVCSSGSTTSSGAAEQPCSSGFLTASGQPNVFGGTSFVAPSFAGILARVEQKLGNTTGLGNVGPVLYGLSNMANVYHDITSGNNSVECIQGTANCPNGGPIGYNAGPGYDQASGLGTIDVANMVNSWSTAVPTSSAGVVGPGQGCNPGSPTAGTASCITTTTVTTTASASCGVTGNFALSATVAGGISGTVPSGTVQFLVDNVAVSGGQVSLVNGIATFSLNTASLSSGGHMINAVYSGDANYAGSKGTLLGSSGLSAATPNGTQSILTYPNGELASVDVISNTKPDFSLTPCVGALSVQPGATSTGVTFTVTPVNGFTGSVNLTITNRDGMAATPSFSVSPVTINGATGATSSFVIKASATSSTASLTPPAGKSSGRAPWYAAGSGVTLAGMLLLTLPRRRRWGTLLIAALSVAALTAVGCGTNSSTSGTGTPTGPTNPTGTTTNASPGTYTFTITATGANGLVHSTEVAITVP